MRIKYPKFYGIAKSTFFDEALNTKAVNSGSTMSFLHDIIRRADGEEEVLVNWEHDEADGE